ncbi:MAG TPA: enoyl-CoA hydratase/isomerase family protein [Dehalococcoidia bacterium]|nr:enoyl-CoA hydratase/isomerase family protein [Dehalococcoidia bacterium]
MQDSIVLYEARDGVAWVTLNRPRVLNAINLELRDALWSLLDAIDLDDEVRVVVFRGAGSAFSSGADVSEFGTAPSYTEARRARVERDLWGRLLHFQKPCIAAIHGYALGAGCELSLLCDFRIAASDARFGLPETHLGYLPTAGGSQTLPRTIGRGRALDMILSAETIDATGALDYGLVHAIVPPEDLDAAVGALARRLLAQPPEALRLAKQALVEGAALPLADALRLERRVALGLRS